TSLPRFNFWFGIVQAGVHDQLWQSSPQKGTAEKASLFLAVNVAPSAVKALSAGLSAISARHRFTIIGRATSLPALFAAFLCDLGG
ncbi:MAG TPA: hypothetical protein VFJ47_12735, partial [Terriglobales bacterium]|nr:hypothetical protein [Terriglobales bacterium]